MQQPPRGRPVDGQYPSDGPSREERTWAMLCHLSALMFLVPLVVNIVAPLVIWLVKRKDSAFVADHGKEAIIFNITVTVALIVCFPFAFLLGCSPLLIFVALAWLVYVVTAAVRARAGVAYRYPYSIRFTECRA